MEPVLGFEPRTDGLQNRCSTTELNWPKSCQKVPPNSAKFNDFMAPTASRPNDVPGIDLRAG